MASNMKFSYKKIKHEGPFYGSDEEDEELYNLREKVIGKVRRRRLQAVKIKKMKIKIPCINRLFKRKATLLSFAWNKIFKRLKQSKSHFCDLFAGNYLFVQVTPTPLKVDKNL